MNTDKVYYVKYGNGICVYCSICEKMFYKKDNPNLRCFCCNVKLRNHSKKVRGDNRLRKYIT